MNPLTSTLAAHPELFQELIDLVAAVPNSELEDSPLWDRALNALRRHKPTDDSESPNESALAYSVAWVNAIRAKGTIGPPSYIAPCTHDPGIIVERRDGPHTWEVMFFNNGLCELTIFEGSKVTVLKEFKFHL